VTTLAPDGQLWFRTIATRIWQSTAATPPVELVEARFVGQREVKIRIRSQRPVRGWADKAGKLSLFSRLPPIFSQLKVVAAEVRNPFVEQSDRIESPSIANKASKVTMADMHS
jgi:hypothetical protein